MTKNDNGRNTEISTSKASRTSAEYDWSSVPPSTAVVEVIASAVGGEELALESLYESIDPDALDALLRTGDEHTTEKITVSFVYASHDVTIHSSGSIQVRPVNSENTAD
jgi:hypothetical protein